MLGFGVSQLFVGEIAARYGRHKTLLGGYLLYFLSSLACALSVNIFHFILFRFFQALCEELLWGTNG